MVWGRLNLIMKGVLEFLTVCQAHGNESVPEVRAVTVRAARKALQ